MRPIFGVDKSDRKNKNDNSEIFLAAKVSDELTAEYEAVTDKVFEENEKELDKKEKAASSKKTSKKLTVFAILSAVLLVMILATGRSSEIVKEDPWMILFPVALIAAFGIHTFYTRVIKKKDTSEEATAGTDGSEDTLELLSFKNDPRVKEIEAKIYASLGAPETAKDVDILHFDYKIENGEPTPKKTFKKIKFVNVGRKIFKDGDLLCLVDEDSRYELPLSGTRGIKTVKGEFSLILWNKSVPCDEGEYRLYGMKKSAMDNVLFDTYHILEIEKDGEIYGLYFPCYELSAREELTGLSAE